MRIIITQAMEKKVDLCYFSLQMQTWTYSLSNNSDYYVIKHRHDTVSLQIQIYNKGRESYHSHKHSQTHKNFFLNILFLVLILDFHVVKW